MSRCNTMQIGMVYALKQFGLSHGLVQKVMQDIGRPVTQGLISDTMLQWRNHELIGQLFRAEFNQLLELRSSNPNQYYKKVYARMANEGPEGVFIKNRRKYDPFAIRITHKKNADSDSSSSSSSGTDSDEDNYKAMKKILRDYMKQNNQQSESNSKSKSNSNSNSNSNMDSESDDENDNSWISQTDSEDEDRDKNNKKLESKRGSKKDKKTINSDSDSDFERNLNEKGDFEDNDSKSKQKKKLVVPSFLKNKQKVIENKIRMDIEKNQMKETEYERKLMDTAKKLIQPKQITEEQYLKSLKDRGINQPHLESKSRGRKKQSVTKSGRISQQQRDINKFVQAKLKIMRAQPKQEVDTAQKGLIIVKPIKKPINIIRKPISKPVIVKKFITKR